MKKIKKLIPVSVISAIMIVLIMLGLSIMLSSCQGAARSFGGDITLELEPNQKLELITWKDDDSLWYLTRPMREDEEPETHVYQQSSEWGVFEGTVTIIESKE